MENSVDFLLDSNWLVTLSSILVTIYVFVLSVPVLLQQTFMPERLREVATHHDYFKKEIEDLGSIGILLLLFVFLYGNPAWKYLLYSVLDKDNLQRGFFITHITGVIFFGLVVVSMYSFLKKYILFRTGQKANILVLRKNVLRTVFHMNRYKSTHYLKILDIVRVNIILKFKSNKESTASSKLDYIDDLSILGNVADDSLNREQFLVSVQEIVTCVLSDTKYNGDILEPIIQDVLHEEIRRNFDRLSASNISIIIVISKLIAKRHAAIGPHGENLNSFDINEVRKLLVSISSSLVDKISVNGNDQLFMEAFGTLRSVSPSYYDCFLIQRELYNLKNYKYAWIEANNLKKKIEESSNVDNPSKYYFIAYLAWFLESQSESLKNRGKTEFVKFIERDKGRLSLYDSAITFFEHRAEFDTVDYIRMLIPIVNEI